MHIYSFVCFLNENKRAMPTINKNAEEKKDKIKRVKIQRKCLKQPTQTPNKKIEPEQDF